MDQPQCWSGRVRTSISDSSPFRRSHSTRRTTAVANEGGGRMNGRQLWMREELRIASLVSDQSETQLMSKIRPSGVKSSLSQWIILVIYSTPPVQDKKSIKISFNVNLWSLIWRRLLSRLACDVDFATFLPSLGWDEKGFIGIASVHARERHFQSYHLPNIGGGTCAHVL